MKTLHQLKEVWTLSVCGIYQYCGNGAGALGVQLFLCVQNHQTFNF